MSEALKEAKVTRRNGKAALTRAENPFDTQSKANVRYRGKRVTC